MAKQVNRLSQENQFRLMLAMQTAQEEIDRDKLTAASYAAVLAGRLGFDLTVPNVESVARLVGVKFYQPNKVANVWNGMKSRLDRIEAENKSLADRVAFLETQLGVQIGTALKVVSDRA